MVGMGDKSSFGCYHPAVNFIYFVIVIAISMSSMNPWFLAFSFAASFAYSIILKGWSAIRVNFFLIIPIVLVSGIINTFFYHDGVTVLFYIFENAVTREALIYGLMMGLMLSSVLMWFSCYTVIMTSDKFIYLFGRILPTLALTISMIFRYIPLIRKRFKEISEGQRCMGRDLKEGSFVKRMHQAAKEVSILISWSLESAIDTSDSMEARGYGLHGRSSFNLFVFSKQDGRLLAGILALGLFVIVGCLMGKTTIYYYPVLMYVCQDVYSYITYALYFVILVLPMAVDIGGELHWRQLRLKM